MSDRTQVIREGETIAYTRTPKPTWQHKVEYILDRYYDLNCALWDWMPAIAAGAFLMWLINVFHP